MRRFSPSIPTGAISRVEFACRARVFHRSPGAIGGSPCPLAPPEGIALLRARGVGAARLGRQSGNSGCRSHPAGPRGGKALGNHGGCHASPTPRFAPPPAPRASGRSDRTSPRVPGGSGPQGRRLGRKIQVVFPAPSIRHSAEPSFPKCARPTLASEPHAPAPRASCYPHHRRRGQSAPVLGPRGRVGQRGQSALVRRLAHAKSWHCPHASAG